MRRSRELLARPGMAAGEKRHRGEKLRGSLCGAPQTGTRRARLQDHSGITEVLRQGIQTVDKWKFPRNPPQYPTCIELCWAAQSPGASQAHPSCLPEAGWADAGSPWQHSLPRGSLPGAWTPSCGSRLSFRHILEFLPSRHCFCDAFCLERNRLTKPAIWTHLQWLISSFSSKP